MIVRHASRTFATQAISRRLRNDDVTLEQAVAVEVPRDLRDPQGWPGLLIAAELRGLTLDAIGVWAVGTGIMAPKPVRAVNTIAREWSSWNEAARPHSAASDHLDRLADSEPATQVVAILRAMLRTVPQHS